MLCFGIPSPIGMQTKSEKLCLSVFGGQEFGERKRVDLGQTADTRQFQAAGTAPWAYLPPDPTRSHVYLPSTVFQRLHSAGFSTCV